MLTTTLRIPDLAHDEQDLLDSLLEQLEANLRAADLHLTAAENAALDAASDLHATDYPYGEMGVQQRDRRLAGGR